MKNAKSINTVKMTKIFDKVTRLVQKLEENEELNIWINSIVFTPIDVDYFFVEIKGGWAATTTTTDAIKDFKLSLSKTELELFSTKQIIAILTARMVELIDNDNSEV